MPTRSLELGARSRRAARARPADDRRAGGSCRTRPPAVSARVVARRRAGDTPLVRAVELTFALGWAAFWIFWPVAAFFAKRGRILWSRELEIRAVIVVIVIVLVRSGVFRDHALTTEAWRDGLGLVLHALGLGFAIWARVHIGRNWGGPMTQKNEPELVTTGPYRLVRHPIYVGILVAGVGTAVALSWPWLTAVVLGGSYFVYSAVVEERYMTEQFPDTYPAYKRSTKMFVPFVF